MEGPGNGRGSDGNSGHRRELRAKLGEAVVEFALPNPHSDAIGEVGPSWPCSGRTRPAASDDKPPPLSRSCSTVDPARHKGDGRLCDHERGRRRRTVPRRVAEPESGASTRAIELDFPHSRGAGGGEGYGTRRHWQRCYEPRDSVWQAGERPQAAVRREPSGEVGEGPSAHATGCGPAHPGCPSEFKREYDTEERRNSRHRQPLPVGLRSPARRAW